MTMRVMKSPTHAHVEWIELHEDGIMHECAILKKDTQGNKMFFPTNYLDEIDKQRLASILADRNAKTFELWDLMAQKTLGNGMNALLYFHQFAKLLTANGKILDPKTGQIGVPTTGTVTLSPEDSAVPAEDAPK